jgi:cysteine desulfurase
MPADTPIDLDHNATTPIWPEVAELLRRVQLETPGNPESPHSAGRAARRVLEAARERLGALLGCQQTGLERQTDRVIFTSGGTEANNLAIFGLGSSAETQADKGTRLIISAIEHPSIRAAAEHCRRLGQIVEHLPVDSRGVVDVVRLGELLASSPRPRLVSVMLANNETGVIQPVAEIAALCHAAGVLCHTDAVQVAGKLPLDFGALGVDALTLAAHKFHGPRGIGALVVRAGVQLQPQLYGGFQQAELRPGTENPALAAAMTYALEQALAAQDERLARMRVLQQRFENGLRERCAPVVIHGSSVERLPQTTNAAFLGLDRQKLVLALDFAGVLCATGSACASGSSEPSPVLLAMQLPAAEVESSLRFSWGAMTSEGEIDTALSRIAATVKRLRESR